MNKQFLMFGLCLVSLFVLINIAESKPQLTFSTNWDGGKRSEHSDYNELETQLLEDRLRLKRRPGWGKRAVFKSDLIDLNNHPDELKSFDSVYKAPRMHYLKAYDQWLNSDEKN